MLVSSFTTALFIATVIIYLNCNFVNILAFSPIPAAQGRYNPRSSDICLRKDKVQRLVDGRNVRKNIPFNGATQLYDSISNYENESNNDADMKKRSYNSPVRKIIDSIDSALAILIDLILFQKLPPPLPPKMRRVRTQFIAALGNPNSSQDASGAENWGIWRIDPGPRGVYVIDFQSNPDLGKVKNTGDNSDKRIMPSGWEFDPNEFWIEEFGRVMEKPDFPLPPGRYLVTGGRETTALLTIDSPNQRGKQGWRLEGGEEDVTLYDVTHLPCRSARYRPMNGKERSPVNANWGDFPVRPGAQMPLIEGCNKLDYAVLFVLAVDDD